MLSHIVCSPQYLRQIIESKTPMIRKHLVVFKIILLRSDQSDSGGQLHQLRVSQGVAIATYQRGGQRESASSFFKIANTSWF